MCICVASLEALSAELLNSATVSVCGFSLKIVSQLGMDQFELHLSVSRYSLDLIIKAKYSCEIILELE